MSEKVIQSLRANNFIVHPFDSEDIACTFLLEKIPEGAAVGVGGSLSLNQIGFIEQLQAREDIHFFNQYKPGISRSESLEIRRKSLLSDIYFTGSNAITEEGEIINIDGVGNRVSALSFGPKKVYIVAGKNKVVADREEAMVRIKNHAAPLNARRLGRNTPCTEDGRCHDCVSEERICNITHILQKQPLPERISVVLIQKELGL